MLPNFKILCFVLGKKLLFVTALGSMTGCITAKHSPALVYRIKIEKGDNLRDLANRYKTTPEAIIDRNKLAKNAQLTP